MKKLIGLSFLIALITLFTSCEKEDEVVNLPFEALWETDSVVIKRYNNSNQLTKTESFDKSTAYYSYRFRGVNTGDIPECATDNDLSEEILEEYLVSSDSIRITNDCFWRYVKYQNSIKKGDQTDKINGFSTIPVEQDLDILSQSSSTIVLKKTEEDVPMIGSRTETYLFFTKIYERN